MAAGTQSVSSKRDFYNSSKKEYDHYRNGVHGVELNRGRDHHGVGRRNGWDYSSSTNHLVRRRGGLHVRAEEREAGELSSGSGVDDVFASKPRVGDGERSKFETGDQLRYEKKRKFSPIVWDREKKEVRISSKNRVVPTATLSSLSLPESSGEVKNVASNEGPIPTSVKPPVAAGCLGVTISESPAGLSSSLSQEWSGVDERGEEQVEGEDVVQPRNISMSRWASEGDSPRDMCYDDEYMFKRKEMVHHADVLKTVSDTQMSSPENGEFRREGSEGDMTKSSGSEDGGCLVGLTSGDEYSDIEMDNNNFMDIDEKKNEISGVNQFSSDFEGDSDSCQNEEPKAPTQRSINMLEGCRSVFEYEKLNKINEGTYGVVYRARDKKTGEIVALKKVKMGIDKDGFPLSALREMNILLSFHHPSIVDVKEVVMGDLDSVFMVMEYMEHDLKGLMEVMKQPLSISEVKCLMLQLLKGVSYLHENWVLHRDLKTSNILLNNRGELKICDFGMSRQYGSPSKPYTPLVVTLWYRAPELLLGKKQYSIAIDMWSVGCIMAELLAKEPLFSGKTEVDQLDKIFRMLGTPNETIWPGFSKLPGVKANFVKQPYNLLRKKFPATSFTGSPVLSDSGFDLLNKLLTFDPEKRITAEDALNHDWFREVPLPKSKDFMPTFPSQNARDRHLNQISRRQKTACKIFTAIVLALLQTFVHMTIRHLQRILKSPDPFEEQKRVAASVAVL
ncbi:hypothetical protein L1049_027922 [Liquidambar formosana]|uniref:cyclin-dependent kinase n=1 Tax=Liquidambar formosana TaxID=63359 RepID=A0AAP0RJL8_LIQFO